MSNELSAKNGELKPGTVHTLPPRLMESGYKTGRTVVGGSDGERAGEGWSDRRPATRNMLKWRYTVKSFSVIGRAGGTSRPNRHRSARVRAREAMWTMYRRLPHQAPTPSATSIPAWFCKMIRSCRDSSRTVRWDALASLASAVLFPTPKTLFISSTLT